MGCGNVWQVLSVCCLACNNRHAAGVSQPPARPALKKTLCSAALKSHRSRHALQRHNALSTPPLNMSMPLSPAAPLLSASDILHDASSKVPHLDAAGEPTDSPLLCLVVLLDCTTLLGASTTWDTRSRPVAAACKCAAYRSTAAAVIPASCLAVAAFLL
jgi:hypothetical protein